MLSYWIIRALPPRSTAGQLTLDQHIGVRIPGEQPNIPNKYIGLYAGGPDGAFYVRFVSVMCPQMGPGVTGKTPPTKILKKSLDTPDPLTVVYAKSRTQ